MSAIYIRSEELRKKIRIQFKAEPREKDQDGFSVEKWQDLGASSPEQIIFRSAKWQWLHGSEFWKAQAIQSKAIAEVTIRYVSGIAPDMRVLYKGKPYNIIPPIDNILEQNRFIAFKVEIVEGG
jgi:SPP1 family predicted phage head-tail adaptor